ANAACIKHDIDQDDGVSRNENTYLASASADAVRRFYEGTFGQNGWTVTESKQHTEDSYWDYTIMQGQRRLKVEVDKVDPMSRLFRRSRESKAGTRRCGYTVRFLLL